MSESSYVKVLKGTISVLEDDIAEIQSKLAASEARETRLRVALEEIAEAPNRLGLDADSADQYAKDAWKSAHDALAEPQDVSKNPGVEKLGSCT